MDPVSDVGSIINKAKEISDNVDISDDFISGSEEDVQEIQGGDTVTITNPTSSPSDGHKRKQEALILQPLKKGKSRCWDHFDKIRVADGETPKCACRYCKKEFTCSSRSGTGHLLRHMEKCLKKDSRDVGQLIQSQGKMELVDTSFSYEKSRELLAGAIAMHSIPFRFVEYRGFRAYHQYIHPGLPTCSRNTIKADILKLYETERIKLQNLLIATPGRISITSDTWTSLNNDGYLTITVHFIDADWNLKKYILCLRHMTSPHTGFRLSEKIYDILAEWGISEKLCSLTLDNAYSNDLSISLLKTKLNDKKTLLLNGDLFHIRCCAHILNLIVQEGFKVIDPMVEKIRESIKYVKGSQSRKQKFMEYAKGFELDLKNGLRQDVSTRWNSTYIMLDNALYFKDVFNHYRMGDPIFPHFPSSLEWDRCKRLCEFLSPFYELTCLFSGTKYPTSNLFFPLVVLIYENLKTGRNSFEDKLLQGIAENMFKKFEEYWSSFNEILAISAILDPRYKFEYVKWTYSRIFTEEEAQFHSHDVRKRLSDLFNEYHQASDSSSSKSASSSGTSSSSQNAELNQNANYEHKVTRNESRFLNAYAKTQSLYMDFCSMNLSIQVQKSELEEYLEEKIPFVNDKEFDVLQYWSKHSSRYPIISAMARDILCIPLTTVASESAFSSTGHIITRFRSSIKSENAEALLCLQDWLCREEDILDDMRTIELEVKDVLQASDNDERDDA